MHTPSEKEGVNKLIQTECRLPQNLPQGAGTGGGQGRALGPKEPRNGRRSQARPGSDTSRTECRPQPIQQEEGTGRATGPKGEPESLLPARKWEEASCRV